MGDKLTFIVEAIDKATNPVKAIGNEIEGLAKKSDGLGSVLKGGLAVGALGAVAAIGTLGVVIGSSVKEAMAAEEIQAQLGAVLKSTGGAAGVTAEQVNSLAETMSTVTKFEDDAIVSGENMLLTFTNIGKDVFPDATKAMLDMSQALGQDLGSSAMQLGKALNDPLSGMAALQRVGVRLTQSQQDEIKSLLDVKTQTDELNKSQEKAQEILATYPTKIAVATEKLDKMRAGGKATAAQIAEQEMAVGKLVGQYDSASDIVDEYGQRMKDLQDPMKQHENLIRAQKILLGELTTEFGGSAEAAGKTFAGQLEILKNQLGNVKESIGGAFLPVLTQLATTLGPVLVKAAQDFADWIVNKLFPALQQFGSFLQTNVIPVLQQLGQWIMVNVVPALRQMWDWVNTYVMPVVKALAEVAFAGLKLAFETLTIVWNTVLRPALNDLWTFLSVYVVPIVTQVATVVRENAGPAFLWFRDRLLEVKDVLNSIREFLAEKIPAAVEAVKEAFNSAKDAIGGVIGKIQEFLDKIGNAIQRLKEFLGLQQGGTPAPSPTGGTGNPNMGGNPWQAPTSTTRSRQTASMAPVSMTLNFYGNVQPAQVAQAAQTGVLQAARAMGIR